MVTLTDNNYGYTIATLSNNHNIVDMADLIKTIGDDENTVDYSEESDIEVEVSTVRRCWLLGLKIEIRDFYDVCFFNSFSISQRIGVQSKRKILTSISSLFLMLTNTTRILGMIFKNTLKEKEITELMKKSRGQDSI